MKEIIIPTFSIVIPVYNRAWSVRRAVESALSFSEGDIPIEIILVDDASSDDSVDVVKKLIDEKRETPHVSFQFHQHFVNLGVCGAKNSGARIASGMWIIFLDSDDELISGSAEHVHAALALNENYPMHFFKCIGEDEVAPISDVNSFDLRDFGAYFKRGTDGEALPIIKADVFKKYLYDEDVRGYESLAYLRIVRAYSFAVINSLVVRRYYTTHDDRLSSKDGMKRRYRDLAKGHLRVIKEHGSVMPMFSLIKQFSRYAKTIFLLKFK